ncbi:MULTISPECIES: hypothetical protein [unclassified Clostridium]|uniref:hypothetical protein n=1 Tax=unclassified Clostridium TaxID=2614128 RepID=UPI0032163B8D
MENKGSLFRKLAITFVIITGIIIGVAIGTTGRVTYNASEFDKQYEEKLKLLEDKSQEVNLIKNKITNSEKSIEVLKSFLKEKE